MLQRLFMFVVTVVDNIMQNAPLPPHDVESLLHSQNVDVIELHHSDHLTTFSYLSHK